MLAMARALLPVERPRKSAIPYSVTMTTPSKGEAVKPAVLQLGATLLVRLVDVSTGERVTEGEIEVLFPSGRRKGPFPANAAGVRVRSLEPGPVRVVARTVGYLQEHPVSVLLEAGKQAELVLELRPIPAPASDNP